jgi:NAD-dependent deacetylase
MAMEASPSLPVRAYLLKAVFPPSGEPEGFWTIGSREYHPQEMATRAMFNVDPESVWVWYLYRMGLCQQARPNAGHLALAEMESLLGDRFTLITQNVDNLHLLAGNSQSRTLQIHGNIFHARCASACTDKIVPLPDGLRPKGKGSRLTERERRRLTCPVCGNWIRPHVLWFDETYNERYYRFRSALEAAADPPADYRGQRRCHHLAQSYRQPRA